MLNRRSLDDKDAFTSGRRSKEGSQSNFSLVPSNSTGASQFRVILAATLLLFSFLFLFNMDRVFPTSDVRVSQLSDEINSGFDWGDDIQATNPKLQGEIPEPILDANGMMQLRKAVVLSSYKNQNVDWLEDLKKAAPDWEVYRYVPDASPSNDENDDLEDLGVANPNGREALPYLTFITDNYATLPDIIIFNHGHSQSWHQPEPIVDKVIALNLTALHREQYINLRCQQTHGCTEDSMFYISNPRDQRGGHFIKLIWEELMEPEVGPIPDTLARPCCAQFAVTKQAILGHSLAFWNSLRKPLETRQPGMPGWRGKSDYEVGLKFEMFWHVLFGKEAIHCPSRETCENEFFSGAIHCTNAGDDIKGHQHFEEIKDDLICVNDLRVD